jgi:hypothetical protein
MIIVDSREPLPLQAIGDVVERLTYGDFIISVNEKKLILERKTLSGFYSDLHSGRLNEQLTGCDGLIIHHNNEEENYIGELKDYYDKVNGISTHHSVFHVVSIQHLSDTLRRYEKYMADGSYGNFRMFAKKAQLPFTVRILAQFDGIGVDRAWLLWEHFGSLENVFAALTSDFEDEKWPRGIGPVLYERIQANMRARYLPKA